MKLDNNNERMHRRDIQEKSLDMERVRNTEKERQMARLLYYGMFSVGVLLLAFAGDVQSIWDEAIAVTLMTIAAFRLRDIQQAADRTEESSRFSEWQRKSSPLHL